MSFACRLRGHAFSEDGFCRRCGVDRAGERVPSAGLRYRRTEDKSGYVVLGVKKNRDAVLTVPPYHRGKAVKQIAARAFAHDAVLQKVILPDTLEAVGAYAFAYSPVETVCFGNAGCTLGEGVFHSCASLTELPLPKGITRLPPHAFALCTSLCEVCLPDTIVEVGQGAFAGCAELTSFTYDHAAATLGVGVFEGCIKLTSLALPEGMTELPDKLLCGCEALQEIRLNEGITSIGQGALAYCASLTELVLPPALESIGAGACQGCTGLTALALPDTLMEIGGDAEQGGAFEGCTALATVEMHKGLHRLGARCVGDCAALTEIQFRGTSADWRAIAKEDGWDEGSATYVVHCINGRIRKGC